MKKVNRFLQSNPDPCENPNPGGAVEFIKYQLEPVVEYFLYVVGIFVIVGGALNSLHTGWKDRKTKENMDEILTHMRIRMSETVTLGLTFILGAEVVKTFRVPNLYQLIKVALLVLLRQLITYFLDKDVVRLKKQYPDL